MSCMSNSAELYIDFKRFLFQPQDLFLLLPGDWVPASGQLSTPATTISSSSKRSTTSRPAALSTAPLVSPSNHPTSNSQSTPRPTGPSRPAPTGRRWLLRTRLGGSGRSSSRRRLPAWAAELPPSSGARRP